MIRAPAVMSRARRILLEGMWVMSLTIARKCEYRRRGGVIIDDTGLGLAPGHPDYGRARVALLLVGVATLGVAVGVLPLGAASARWGRGRMIVAGLALATVAGLSLGVLTPWWALVTWAYCVPGCFLRQLGVWPIYCYQEPHLFDLEWSRPLVWIGWLLHAGSCTPSPSAAWLCIRGFTTQLRSGGLPHRSS